MPEKIKKPRTEAQKAATAKLVAANKAKREAKKNLLAFVEKPAEEPVEESVSMAITKVAADKSDDETQSESESESDRDEVPDRSSAASARPADFAGEAHHVADDVRERAEKSSKRRSRSVSAFNYRNKNILDN